MKALFPLFLLGCLFVFVSCNGAEKKASEKVVQDFYTALRKSDSLQIKKFYPDFEKLGSYMKSKRIEILGVEKLDNELYEVKIHNYFTNGFGKKFDQEISFFCQKDPKNKDKFIINDSKNLCDFSETNEYQFAANTGFINKKEVLTDQEIAKKILKSQDLLEVLFKEKIEALRKEIVIENWGWEYGYVNTYADGHGKVVNRSKDDFSTLKFKLTFVDDKGNITATDDGYLIYDKLKAGETKDFTTLSSDIGAATKAYIQLDFDAYEILNQIYAAKYKGNEFRLLKRV